MKTDADRCQNDGSLSLAFREFSKLHEELERNFVEGISEPLIFDLLVQLECVIKEISAIPGTSIEKLRLKICVLSSLLSHNHAFELLEGCFNSFIYDFDKFVAVLSGSLFMSADLTSLTTIQHGNTCLRQTTITSACDEFRSVWEEVRKLCDTSKSPENDLEDSVNLKVEGHWSKLEELVYLLAATDGMTLPEIVCKREVLDICLKSRVEFSNVYVLANSFINDFYQVLFKPENASLGLPQIRT
jgi:hypothetical protein